VEWREASAIMRTAQPTMEEKRRMRGGAGREEIDFTKESYDLEVLCIEPGEALFSCFQEGASIVA
jgi:hypothetical protein